MERKPYIIPIKHGIINLVNILYARSTVMLPFNVSTICMGKANKQDKTLILFMSRISSSFYVASS